MDRRAWRATVHGVTKSRLTHTQRSGYRERTASFALWGSLCPQPVWVCIRVRDSVRRVAPDQGPHRHPDKNLISGETAKREGRQAGGAASDSADDLCPLLSPKPCHVPTSPRLKEAKVLPGAPEPYSASPPLHSSEHATALVPPTHQRLPQPALPAPTSGPLHTLPLQ